MGKTKGNIRHGKGRPIKAPDILPPSRRNVKCFCCADSGRRDRVIDHVRNLVVWAKDQTKSSAIPAKETDIDYIEASFESKQHTDYLRRKGYNFESFKLFLPSQKTSGSMNIFTIQNITDSILFGIKKNSRKCPHKNS